MSIRQSNRHARIGLIQVDHRASKSRAERQDELISLATSCCNAGADLVLFPEAYQHAADKGILLRRADLIEEGKRWRERCAELARKYHAYIVPWDYLPTENGFTNASYILNRSGELVGTYCKTHYPYDESEQLHMVRGNDFPVFELDFGKVGIMICFDNYFPEVARILALKGAEVVLFPLYGDALPIWESKVRVRAADNGIYIVTSQIDMSALRAGIAFSGVFSPEGELLHKLTEPGWAIVDINPGAPVMTHTMRHSGEPEEDLTAYLRKVRAPELYTELTDPDERQIPWEDVYTEVALKKRKEN